MTDMPAGWSTAPLSAIAEVLRGVTFKKADARNDPADGLLPILRATNINGHLSLESDLVYVPEHYVSEKQRVQVEDIIVAASSGSAAVVGKSARLKRDWTGGFGAFCAVIRPSSLMAPGYLAHFVASPAVRRTWTNQALGTNINNLKLSDIENTAVPLAPLPEQHRIVAAIEERLSRLDAAMAALERAEQNLRRMRAAAFEAVVDRGDPTEPLGALGEGPGSIVDGPFGSNLKTEHYVPTGPRVIRLQNVGAEGDFVDARAHITQSHFERLQRHSVRTGDIVCAILGEVLPRAVIVPEGIAPAIVKADCPRVRLSADVNATFVWGVLNSPSTRRLVATKIKGVGRPRLTLRELKRIPVPLPSRVEQDKRALLLTETLTNIKRLESQLVESRRHVASLHSSVLSSAFSGKLVPQDPTEGPASVLLDRVIGDGFSRHDRVRTRQRGTPERERDKA